MMRSQGSLDHQGGRSSIRRCRLKMHLWVFFLLAWRLATELNQSVKLVNTTKPTGLQLDCVHCHKWTCHQNIPTTAKTYADKITALNMTLLWRSRGLTSFQISARFSIIMPQMIYFTTIFFGKSLARLQNKSSFACTQLAMQR